MNKRIESMGEREPQAHRRGEARFWRRNGSDRTGVGDMKDMSRERGTRALLRTPVI